MREIKFRGMMTTGKFVFGEVYSDLPNSTAYYKECSQRICWHEGIAQLNAPVKNGTISQFVGMVDKNEIDVYENDKIVIRDEVDKIGVVKWDEIELRYIVEFDTYMLELGNFYGKEIEVIGNIHEVSV